MKILLLGSGGREHALASHFVAHGHQVLALPGSDAIKALPNTVSLSHLSSVDCVAVLAAAIQHKVDLAVSGPEMPLAKGVADLFLKNKIPFFGPTAMCAQLESSKVFAKDFMRRHKVPTAKFHLCRSMSEAKDALNHSSDWKGFVVKPSGLTGGKGVVVCSSQEEAFNVLHSYLEKGCYGKATDHVVLEERLEGPELSLFVLLGKGKPTFLATAQDYKRLLEGGLGPNTGGMGAISPVSFAGENLIKGIWRDVVMPTVEGLKEEKLDYCGFLYFGLMLTKEGPQLLEYNCRLGDPETQAVMPLLESDLAHAMLDTIKGNSVELILQKKYGCVVVAASEGYPENPITGRRVYGLENQDGIYHAGTKKENHWITTGGRVLGVTAVAESLDEAVKRSYEKMDKIQFEGIQVRRDIGNQQLVTV